MKFKFSDNSGNDIFIKIPNIKDIPLSSMIDFEDMGMSLVDLPDDQLINTLIKAIGLITGNDEQELKNICIETDQIELNMFEENLFTIYRFITDLFTNYIPDDNDNHDFEHKGKHYLMPHLIKETFTGKKLFTPVTVAQALEVLKTKEILRKVKIDADTRFSCFIKIVSILLIEKDQIIPDDEHEFNIMIEDRMAELEDIDCATAKKLYFFLSSTMEK